VVAAASVLLWLGNGLLATSYPQLKPNSESGLMDEKISRQLISMQCQRIGARKYQEAGVDDIERENKLTMRKKWLWTKNSGGAQTRTGGSLKRIVR
jgi:hypothetical protein